MTDPVTLALNADELIRSALREDISTEDVSTNAVMREYREGSVQLICKQDGVICGLGVFARTFEILDKNTAIKFYAKDGDKVRKSQVIADITGDIRVLLQGGCLKNTRCVAAAGITTGTTFPTECF